MKPRQKSLVWRDACASAAGSGPLSDGFLLSRVQRSMAAPRAWIEFIYIRYYAFRFAGITAPARETRSPASGRKLWAPILSLASSARAFSHRQYQVERVPSSSRGDDAIMAAAQPGDLEFHVILVHQTKAWQHRRGPRPACLRPRIPPVRWHGRRFPTAACRRDRGKRCNRPPP